MGPRSANNPYAVHNLNEYRPSQAKKNAGPLKEGRRIFFGIGGALCPLATFSDHLIVLHIPLMAATHVAPEA